ncbi:unnamed protein product [Durusdinium trenchii]|uniref:Uncharacterized protein n=1 Tax=Durusdinium trenchii TaxID=1381693 RepID=A0ABP0HNQ2_9DINO
MGDSSYGLFIDTSGLSSQEYLLIAREDEEKPGLKRVVVILSVPENKFPEWLSPFYNLLLEKAYAALVSCLNRPGVSLMRSIDAQFYTVLGLRCFNRGLPLLPERVSDTPGAVSGLMQHPLVWKPFQVEDADGKFRLAAYLRCLLRRLGMQIQIYQTYEGRALVPYQCVVQTQQWQGIRKLLLEALALQRTAYRRLHGGSTAPALVEHAKVRTLAMDPADRVATSVCVPKWVVRNTFWELDEDAASVEMKRCRSAGPMTISDIECGRAF